MPIQPWRTFLLTGVVPETHAGREAGWPLQEPHRVDPRAARHTQADRLLGTSPIARLAAGAVEIDASSDTTAVYRSASLALDADLVGGLEPGDVLTLARTMTGDIGVSLMRGGTLWWAAGAVAAVPLGGSLRVRLGPPVSQGRITAGRWPAEDTWLDVSCGGETRALRAGETVTIGDYELTIRRTASPADATSARRENAAISRADPAWHAAVLRAADRLAGEDGGLRLRPW